MMKWLTLVVVILTGCSSVSQKTYYQLPHNFFQAKKKQEATIHILFINQINLSDYLDSSGIVYQLNEVQYHFANSQLWASPLKQQLRESMVENLSYFLPGWLIVAHALKARYKELSVNVTGFHGRYDGKVVISGQWTVESQGSIFKKNFYLLLPQYETGYDSLVNALAQGWKQVARQIAMDMLTTKY